MLALATGWTPDVLADLPARFRAACHHVILLRTLLPDEGLPPLPRSTAGMTPQQKADVARASVAQADLRTILFPEDDGV